MKHKPQIAVAVLMTLLAGSAMAATFVVPTDEEMVRKSAAIAVGTVEGSFVQEDNGTIETIYEVRIERTLKGAFKTAELLRLSTLGGVNGERGVLVPGEAHFEQGERVLLFLNRDGRGRWRTTDLTLGRFEFVTSTAGERLLVRDMEDVVGWDHAGSVHKEKVRKETGFLRFIEERSQGRSAATDYVVDAAEVTIAPAEERFDISANATSYPAATYTDFVNNQPIRWPNMANGVRFHKRSDTNIPGAADGGVAVIQGGLAAWNNESGSVINYIYNGQIAKASANHDATNVVEFNDPQGRISGSWSGSGTVGICFLSFSGSHTFLGASWLNITDSDVVFQDGYPATNASFSSAMTHELGHGLGWRHSNQNHATGGACNSAVEECTSAAIMNSSVSANYGFTLQPWDINAAQSVYPGTSTCTAPTITAQPTSRTITAGNSTTLSVTATGTAPLGYQWYFGASGNTGSPVAGATGPSLTVSPSSTTSYWVRVSNSCGSVNSTAATVTVTAACNVPSITSQPTSRTIAAGSSTTLSVTATGTGTLAYQWYIGSSGSTASPISGATGPSVTVSPSATTSYWVRVSNSCGATNSATASVIVTSTVSNRKRADFNGDGISDLLWRNGSNHLAMWNLNGRTLVTTGIFASVPSSSWRIEGYGDFNMDRRYDLLVRNTSTGQVAVWAMNGRIIISQNVITTLSDSTWKFEAFGDFTGDGKTDVIARRSTTGQVALWEINATQVLNSGIIATVGDLNWVIQGGADFTGDGKDELLWRNNASHQVSIWDFSGRVPGTNGLFGAVDGTWTVQGMGDFNRDGRADILWRQNGTSAVSIWNMNGRTVLSRNRVGTVPSAAWRFDAIGDFDADGDDEIILFNTSTAEVAMWEFANNTLANGSTFTSVTLDWRLQPPLSPLR